MQIGDLIDDVLRHIFTFLALQTRGKIGEVCKRWCAASRHPSLWIVVEHSFAPNKRDILRSLQFGDTNATYVMDSFATFLSKYALSPVDLDLAYTANPNRTDRLDELFQIRSLKRMKISEHSTHKDKRYSPLKIPLSSNLELLNMNVQMDLASLITLLKGLPNLKELYLPRAIISNVSDDLKEALAVTTKLERIFLPLLTTELLYPLKQACPSLRYIIYLTRRTNFIEVDSDDDDERVREMVMEVDEAIAVVPEAFDDTYLRKPKNFSRLGPLLVPYIGSLKAKSYLAALASNYPSYKKLIKYLVQEQHFDLNSECPIQFYRPSFQNVSFNSLRGGHDFKFALEAAMKGRETDLQSVKDLIALGARAECPLSGYSYLTFASRADVRMYLIQQGADPNKLIQFSNQRKIVNYPFQPDEDMLLPVFAPHFIDPTFQDSAEFVTSLNGKVDFNLVIRGKSMLQCAIKNKKWASVSALLTCGVKFDEDSLLALLQGDKKRFEDILTSGSIDILSLPMRVVIEAIHSNMAPLLVDYLRANLAKKNDIGYNLLHYLAVTSWINKTNPEYKTNKESKRWIVDNNPPPKGVSDDLWKDLSLQKLQKMAQPVPTNTQPTAFRPAPFYSTQPHRHEDSDEEEYYYEEDEDDEINHDFVEEESSEEYFDSMELEENQGTTASWEVVDQDILPRDNFDSFNNNDGKEIEMKDVEQPAEISLEDSEDEEDSEDDDGKIEVSDQMRQKIQLARQIVLKILTEQKKIDAKDFDWQELLALSNNPEVVNSTTDDGETALLLVCKSRISVDAKLKRVEVLMANGADVNIADKHGWTPLHAACYLSAWDVALALIKANANVNAQDKNGITPIMAAVYGWQQMPEQLSREAANDVLLIKLQTLLKSMSGVDFSLTEKHTNRSFLHLIATINGGRRLIRKLFKCVTVDNWSPVDADGYTPLHYAALFGATCMLKKFIERGCDPNARIPAMGLTPAMMYLYVISPETWSWNKPFLGCLTNSLTMFLGNYQYRDIGTSVDAEDAIALIIEAPWNFEDDVEVDEEHYGYTNIDNVAATLSYLLDKSALTLVDNNGDNYLHYIIGCCKNADEVIEYCKKYKVLDSLWGKKNWNDTMPIHRWTKESVNQPKDEQVAIIIDIIERYNIDIYAQDENGRSIFSWMCSTNHFRYQPELWSKLKGKFNFTATFEKQYVNGFESIIIQGNLTEYVLQVIIDTNPEVLNQPLRRGRTLLLLDLECFLESGDVHMAAFKQFDMILKQNNININHQDDNGDTALHIAARFFHLGVIDSLNGHLASFDDSYGYFYAVFMLLDAGADPTIKNNRGETPMTYVPKLMEYYEDLYKNWLKNKMPIAVEVPKEILFDPAAFLNK